MLSGIFQLPVAAGAAATALAGRAEAGPRCGLAGGWSVVAGLVEAGRLASPLCLIATAAFATPVSAAPAADTIIESFIAPATAENMRNTEADVLVRRDGSLFVAWSDFYAGSRDDAPARISAATSRDGGRTWSPRFTLQENEGKANVMSASLVRSRSGDVLFFYLRKNSLSDLKVFVRRSSDDAKTWSAPVLVTPEDGYHVMNNARVIQLQSGRLLAPVASTRQVWTKNDDFRTVVFFSDDDGRTWRRGRTQLSAPKRGAMEPGLIEMKDGRVLQIIRTQTGFIWHAFSSDGGNTWTDAAPWSIESPESPATLVAVLGPGVAGVADPGTGLREAGYNPQGSGVPLGTGDWLLIWNPVVQWGNPEKTVLGANHGGARTPLAAMRSSDEGRTWSPRRNLESDPMATYAYTSVTFHDGRALLTYYHFPMGGKKLSLKFKSVPLAWFGGER